MNLYYLGKGKNFGDAVNYDIFTGLFGQDVQRARHYTADCYAIGSILGKTLYNTNAPRYARENIKKSLYSIILKQRPINILGSGFIENVLQTMGKPKLFRPVSIVALRGHKTKELMEQILQTSLDGIALGDPGILVSEFIKNKPIEKKYKLGIIPHVVDQESDLLKDFSSRPDTCILDIKASPLEFMRSVAACESIASSTLHGLIAADSLHIPNIWIKISDKIFGKDFKYHDYYSVYGIVPNATDLRSTPSLEITMKNIHDQYQIAPQPIEDIKQSLTRSFNNFFKHPNRARK